MHTDFTSGHFVLSFEFLCSEVGKVVIVKRVPRRLWGGVGGTARCKNSGSRFALVLAWITNTKLDRLGGAWWRCKWSTGEKPHKISWIKQTGEDLNLNYSSGLFQYTCHLLVEGSVSISSLWLLWRVTHWNASNGARRGVTRYALVASFFSCLWRSRWSLIKRGMEWRSRSIS